MILLDSAGVRLLYRSHHLLGGIALLLLVLNHQSLLSHKCNLKLLVRTLVDGNSLRLIHATLPSALSLFFVPEHLARLNAIIATLDPMMPCCFLHKHHFLVFIMASLLLMYSHRYLRLVSHMMRMLTNLNCGHLLLRRWRINFLNLLLLLNYRILRLNFLQRL